MTEFERGITYAVNWHLNHLKDAMYQGYEQMIKEVVEEVRSAYLQEKFEKKFNIIKPEPS